MEEGTGDTRYFQKRLITSTIPDYFQKLGEMGPVARVKDQKPRGSSRSARRTSSTTTTGPPMTREEDWGEDMWGFWDIATSTQKEHEEDMKVVTCPSVMKDKEDTCGEMMKDDFSEDFWEDCWRIAMETVKENEATCPLASEDKEGCSTATCPSDVKDITGPLCEDDKEDDFWNEDDRNQVVSGDTAPLNIVHLDPPSLMKGRMETKIPDVDQEVQDVPETGVHPTPTTQPMVGDGVTIHDGVSTALPTQKTGTNDMKRDDHFVELTERKSGAAFEAGMEEHTDRQTDVLFGSQVDDPKSKEQTDLRSTTAPSGGGKSNDLPGKELSNIFSNFSILATPKTGRTGRTKANAGSPPPSGSTTTSTQLARTHQSSIKDYLCHPPLLAEGRRAPVESGRSQGHVVVDDQPPLLDQNTNQPRMVTGSGSPALRMVTQVVGRKSRCQGPVGTGRGLGPVVGKLPPFLSQDKPSPGPSGVEFPPARRGSGQLATGPGSTGKKKKCSYTKGGRCQIHGEGAERLHRPVVTEVVGLDGKKSKRVTKKFFYSCDMTPKGEGKPKLVQQRLSFFKTTPVNTAGRMDSTQGGGKSSTSTEGQNVSIGQTEERFGDERFSED